MSEIEKKPQKTVHLSLNWKFAIGFSLLFSLVYLVALQGLSNLAVNETDEQIKEELTQALEGAAAGVDVDMLLELAETGEPNAAGFSDDPRWIALMAWLDTVHAIEPDAWPYLYIPAEEPGHVYLVVDLYAWYDKDSSSTFMELYKSNSGYILIGLEEQTYRAVDAALVKYLKNAAMWIEEKSGKGEGEDSPGLASALYNVADWLVETKIAPKREFGTYGDQYGRWASGYMPLANENGEKVAGIGVDFQADMVNAVRTHVRAEVQRAFLLAYLPFLMAIIGISRLLTHPIRSLTDVASRIGKGDEDVDFSNLPQRNLQDELDILGKVLASMHNNLKTANRHLKALSHQLIIEREEDRADLARDLHDNVLGHLSILTTSMQEDYDSKTVRENYQGIIDRLRDTISFLRSPVMEYGLYMALEDFIDRLEDQPGNKTDITLEISPSEERYTSEIETHIYRIIQQACENALGHAKASQITIRGELLPNKVTLFVEDNGEGFSLQNDKIDQGNYVSQKHFGLIGMKERADLIGGKLSLGSYPGKGTIVRLDWVKNDSEE